MDVCHATGSRLCFVSAAQLVCAADDRLHRAGRCPGSAPSDEDLATVRRGVDTKQDIQERFGLPITIGSADPNIWYYVKQDLRPLPLSPPDVIGQRIVVISFDAEELVADMSVKNGIVGDTSFRPDPESSKIYGPDRSAAQEFFRNIFGSVGFK